MCHFFFFQRNPFYLLPNYVTVWAEATVVALNWASVGFCLERPTCFYLGSQDGLRRERQQADEVAHRAVGLFSEAFPELEGVVSGESRVKDDKRRLQSGPASTSEHSGDIPGGFVQGFYTAGKRFSSGFLFGLR